MRLWGVLVGVAVSLVAAPEIGWALTQPNGDPIPTEPGCNGGDPTGLAAAFACVCDQPNVCNIGAVCPDQNSCDDGQNATCETTLWHSFNDNTCIPSNTSGLDVYAEAALMPETFKPTCPQTFSLISRGTALFGDAFGWYNATGSKPDASDLHVMLDCSTTAGAEVVLDLQSEPAYLGGDIGFFIITPESHSAAGSCEGGDCCASVSRLQSGVGYAFYSEREYNPDYAGSDSLIHLLTYQSHVWDNKFYFAWEDIHGASNNDFTDVVTGVSGLHCSGGGQPCDTGGQGVCGRGISLCQQGALICANVFEATTEECNGIDDDCDGEVDDDASCPDEGYICHQGSCVPPCSSKEFPCGGTTVCDPETDLCVDPGCLDASCEGGQVCRQGDCVAPCDGVVCPHGQECVGDRCIDLCAGVSCAGDEACVDGQCLAGCDQCGGITCELPLTCADGGACSDPSCPGGCAEGTHCEAGTCVDDCSGALCPGGQSCVNGSCVDGSGGNGTGGSSLPDPEGGGGGALPLADDGAGSSSGCSCAAGSRSGAAVWLLLLLPGAAASRRRWRRLR